MLVTPPIAPPIVDLERPKLCSTLELAVILAVVFTDKEIPVVVVKELDCVCGDVVLLNCLVAMLLAIEEAVIALVDVIGSASFVVLIKVGWLVVLALVVKTSFVVVGKVIYPVAVIDVLVPEIVGVFISVVDDVNW